MQELNLFDPYHHDNLWEGPLFKRDGSGTLIVLESTYTQGKYIPGKRQYYTKDGKWIGTTYNCVQKFYDREWFDETLSGLVEYVICKRVARETAMDPLAITNMAEEILNQGETVKDYQLTNGIWYLTGRLIILRPRAVILFGDNFHVHGKQAWEDANDELKQRGLPLIEIFDQTWHPRAGRFGSTWEKKYLPEMRETWKRAQE
jgi:hypothetical protein